MLNQEPHADPFFPAKDPAMLTQSELDAQARGAPTPVAVQRTPAEQADFNARVDAEVARKRVEAEKAEVERVAAERHDARVKELEAANDADQKAAADRQAAADKAAVLAAHPHTQLHGLLRDLRAPGALDVNGRIGALHNALMRLVQLVLQHTPAPDAPAQPVETTDGEEWQSREHAEGPVEQVSPGL